MAMITAGRTDYKCAGIRGELVVYPLTVIKKV